MNIVPALDVSLPASRELSKLRILRHHDARRQWQSLADRRVCILCAEEFQGSDIVIEIQNGRAICRCPTRGCTGRIQHFVLAGNPLLEADAWTDWMKAFDEVLQEDGSAA